MAQGKRFKKAVKSFDGTQSFDIKKAVELVKQNATAKFDESFDVAMNLGVDPRKADQLVRGTVALPHGTGKTVRVLVIAKAPKDKEALDGPVLDCSCVKHNLQLMEESQLPEGLLDGHVVTEQVGTDLLHPFPAKCNLRVLPST